MDSFQLSEDTMRGLRNIAQAPGELQWRLELLAKLERMTAKQELFTRAVLGELKRLKENQLKPGAITHIVQSELKPTNRDLKRLWSAGVWALVGTIGALFSGMLALIVMMAQMMKVLPK